MSDGPLLIDKKSHRFIAPFLRERLWRWCCAVEGSTSTRFELRALRLNAIGRKRHEQNLHGKVMEWFVMIGKDREDHMVQ